MYNLLQLPNLKEACELHFGVLNDYIRYRVKSIQKENSNFSDMLSDRRITQGTDIYDINQRIRDFILANSIQLGEIRLSIILKGKPNELYIVNEEFEDYILSDQRPFGIINGNTREYIRNNFSKSGYTDLFSIYKELNLIFNYIDFKSWKPNRTYSSYKMAEMLNMRACTYCNRDYILVHRSDDDGTLLCPQYDHWYPQSKFPLLQVSFYNLIPSCGSCNSSVKSDSVLRPDEYCHPYMEWNNDDSFYYTYYHHKEIGGYKIIAKSSHNNSALLKTVKKLKIDQMYNGHLPELLDIIDLKRAYGENYLKILKNSFPKLNSFKTSDVYRMHFGTEIQEKDFYKKPMSKFKKDILLKLKLIDDDE
ncbi:hypothetical protein [Myroides sp. C6-3]|uniref:hypothetical protein n=2 Tax=unclassified Myroides TaxID=2642485 RepID=UPI003D2F56A8